MPEKITILKDGGESINSNIVSVFRIPESGKNYIITTENAVDPHGLTVLHVSEIQGDTLVKVETDEEWSSIKTIMRAIISSSVGSYQYLPSITQANASGQYSRDISVSAPASKQMIDSYANGEKITPEEEPPAVVEPQGDSIFPTAPVAKSDDEIVPGISEVAPEVTIEATPQASQVDPAVNATTPAALPPMSEPTGTPAPAAPPAGPTEPVAPVIDAGESVEQPVVEPVVVSDTPVEENKEINTAADVGAVPAATDIPVPDITPIIDGTKPVEVAPNVAVPTVEVVDAQMPSVEPVIEDPTATTAPLEANVAVLPPDEEGLKELADVPVLDSVLGVNPDVAINQVPVATPAVDMGDNNMVNQNVSQPVVPPVMPMANNVVPPASVQPAVESVPGNPGGAVNGGEMPQTSAMKNLGISLNFDAQPDLNGNASLDEIVAGAQELFIEGVKNLVMVMTERLYKELRAKEEDLKRREIIVAQREEAINNATTSMMSGNFASQPMMQQPMMQQPMVQQPMMQQPMAQQPMMQQPMMQQPMVQQPMMQQPVVQPTVMQQVPQQPVGQPASGIPVNNPVGTENSVV